MIVVLPLDWEASCFSWQLTFQRLLKETRENAGQHSSISRKTFRKRLQILGVRCSRSAHRKQREQLVDTSFKT